MSAQDEEPGVDGTPAWAYDEDGYCVCCDNGRWKHHMPECELRDALDATVIVRNLAAADEPLTWEENIDGSGETSSCTSCGNAIYTDDLSQHDESCPWRRAAQWVRDRETK
jgi:hypothetical protein